jgi:hypothetical protein
MSSKSIIDVISQCCYPLNIRDYIGNVLIEVSKLSQSAKFFKVQKGMDQVIAIKYNISTTFKDKKFDIPILIYILKNFPYEAPEVYLERSNETGVSPKNPSIDPNTNRISANILNKWNINSKLSDLISEITSSFNTNFPIYKLSSSTVSSNYNSMNTSYSSSNVTKLIPNTIYSKLGINTGNNFNMNNSGYNINQFSYVPQNNMYSNLNQNSVYNQQPSYQNMGGAPGVGYNVDNSNNMFMDGGYNQNQPYGGNLKSMDPGYQHMNSITTNTNNMYNMNNEMNINMLTGTNLNTKTNNTMTDNKSIPKDYHQEEIARKVLVDEIRSQLDNKVREELKRLKSQEEKLKNYQSEFTTQIEKYQKFLAKKDEILTTLAPIMDRVHKEIQDVLTSVANSQDRLITKETALSFININGKDKAILHIISIEATVEDIVTAMKKAFEKGIISFGDNTKLMRNITRELFRIKHYREKLLK